VPFQLSKYLSLVTLLLLGGFNSQAYSKERLNADDFSQLPDMTQANISPDGNKFAWLMSIRSNEVDNNGTGLVVTDLDAGKAKMILKTDNEKFVVRWLEWAGNDTLLLSVVYPSTVYRTPVSATRLLRIDVESGKITSAIPNRLINNSEYVPVYQDAVVDHLPDSPDEVLLSMRTTRKVGREVYRVNHKKRKSKLVQRFRENASYWIADRQHEVRLASLESNTNVVVSHRNQDSYKWTKLFDFEALSSDVKAPIGFAEDPKKLYYLALHEGRKAVFLGDLSTTPMRSELILSDENYDVEAELIYSKKSKQVVGMEHNTGDGYTYWSDDFKRIQTAIDKALPNTLNQIIDFSDDESRVVILSTSDVNAGTYYLFDVNVPRISVIGSRYKALKPSLMSEKQKITYQARDGITIEGFLTQPKANEGKAAPTIIFPHGGPIGSSSYRFDYWTQYFASKGLNVLQMNFRGSSGYGYDFMAQGLQDWGGKMQTDVEDGTRWLIEQNIAEPNRICVVGASYGGYAALMEAANNKDLYQCAISFAGVTDLNALILHYKKYTSYRVAKKQIGSDRKELKSKSPVARVNEIDIPVFLAHGTKDLSVPFMQGKKMRNGLQKANKGFEYLELEGGDHYLSNEDHRVAFFRKMDEFLNEHLDL